MEIDLTNKCRICLSDDEQMHYLFAEFDQGIILVDILKNTTNFEAYENDGLPPYLCQNCTTIMVDFFNLKTIYKENEEQIRALLLAEESNTIANSFETDDSNSIKEAINHENLGNEVDNCVEPENTGTDKSCIKLEILSDNENAVDDENCSYDGNFNNGQKILNQNEREDGEEEEEEEEEESTTEQYLQLDELNMVKIETGHVPYEENLMLSKKRNIVLQYQEIKKYTCPTCGDCYLYEDGIKKHMTFKHQVNNMNFEELCNVTHIKLKKITDEEEEKSNTVNNKCHICNLPCESEEARKEHLETHKKHICEICGLNFLKKSYLKDHKEIHLQEKRHVCEYCHKAFQRRTVLVKHRRIHTHPRECICEICGKAFNDKGTLKTHIMLLHIKTRNYVCMICGVRFPLKATLEKHIRRHTERNRDFRCTTCTSAYKDKSSLDRHILIKHSGVDVKATCKDCGKQYTTTSNLQKHRKICRQKRSNKEEEGIQDEVICLNYDFTS